MLNNASHAQGERAVDRIFFAHAIVSNVVSTFRLFPSVVKPNAKAMLMRMIVQCTRTAQVI